MLYKLISTEGEQAFELRSGAAMVVGRALNCDIPVLDPTISRRHAELTTDVGGVSVRDLQSSNGTFLNGTRIESSRLSPGDVITFGKVAFRLREVIPTPVALRAVPAHGVPKLGATIVRELPVREAPHDLVSAIRRSSGAFRAYDDSTPSPAATGTHQRLQLLLAISQELSRAIEVDALLDKVVRTTFDLHDADRVSILLSDGQGELIPKIARDKQGTETDRTVPQSIARRVVEEKLAILSDNAPEDQRFGGQSILMQRVRSAMCAPLVGSQGRVLGVLYVDNLTLTHRFDTADLEFLVAFAGIAAVAIENSQFAERIRHEALVRSNFERYFAPSLAARIASSPDAVRLGGEKRNVAVLFSDIRGFTSLSESMNPDEMARLLTEYFTEMVDCVFRNGGMLDKFIGDAVMAQWGAPLNTPDDPDHALKAAIDMLKGLGKLNRGWKKMGRPRLQIGIGLNYGEAFAGNIGSEQRLEFTVIGDCVNTASRLCSLADGGEILLTEEFRNALKESYEIEERPPVDIKGKAKPVPVYCVKL